MPMSLRVIIFILVLLLAYTPAVFAMHIMEGFLPPAWSISWGAITLPFVAFGLMSIQKKIKGNPRIKVLLAIAGAFAFVLSAIKIPSVTGSSSHLTGIGFGAIMFGPTTMTVLGLIVLLFQALLLAHGGLTTLGANTFSMAVMGPILSYGVFRLVMKLRGSKEAAVFLAAALGNLMTYVTTSAQLALAFPSETGGILASFAKFVGIFAVTQIPLAISEGILTVLIFNSILAYSKDEFDYLKVFRGRDK